MGLEFFFEVDNNDRMLEYLLYQVMLNLPDEVTNLVSGKLALRYHDLIVQ